MAETITLEFLADQNRRILSEIGLMRDDIKVLTAIALQHETTLLRSDKTLIGMLEQMRTVVVQHSHIVDRVSQFEER
jgi:hypothetical protein